MDKDIIIRDCLNEDIDDISKIEEECFSMPWSLCALEEFFHGNYSHILTAIVDGTVAGYITYTKIFDELQIANIAVSSHMRRMKIGTKLIYSLLDTYKDDTQKITLEVRKSNNAAISLYEKCGFEIVGIRKNYYSKPVEDALLMNYTYQSRKE